MPTAKPISDLQRNMAAITHECQKTKCPIYLTKNGTATLVIMDADAFGEEMSAHHAVYDRKARVFALSCAAMKTNWPAASVRSKTRADARALRTARNGWRGSRRARFRGQADRRGALRPRRAPSATHLRSPRQRSRPACHQSRTEPGLRPACNAAQPPFACRVLCCEHYGIYYRVDETDRAVTVFAIEDQRRNPLTRFESYEYAVEALPSRCDQPRS